METKIEYNNRSLIVQGFIEYEDTSVGMYGDSFICEKIILNDIDIYDEYEEEEIEEIEDLAMKNIEDLNQSNWECANV